MPQRDEPTKLREIVAPMLAGDVEQLVTLRDGALARLVLGATAQDDCAAYHVSGDVTLVIGSDYIRGVGFYLYETGYLDDYSIGWYLAGANLSDIAAMGAAPLALLSVIRYPKDLDDFHFEQLLSGIADSCRASGALNVGGDIGTADQVILSAAAFGLVEPSRLLTRSGAKPGDYICLTGQTGEAGAALTLARAGKLSDIDTSAAERLLSRWRRVVPRVAQGRIFSGVLGVSSCVDTSDGLKAALQALASNSRVKLSVQAELVPVSEPVRYAARILAVPPEEMVLGDSVDFELVATVHPDSLADLESEFARARLPLFVIGRVEEGEGVVWQTAGVEGPVPGKEWRH